MSTEKPTIYDKLLEIQKETGPVRRSKTNPYFESRYFDINQLLQLFKPKFTEKNLLLLQPISNVNGVPALLTILRDLDSGEEIRESCPIPQSGDAQKMGSAITYVRRYALQSLLALEAVDDDGNAASGREVAKAPAKAPAKKLANGVGNPFTSTGKWGKCPACGQGDIVQKKVTKEGPNKGKTFWGCSRGKDQCDYFSWTEPEQELDVNEINV